MASESLELALLVVGAMNLTATAWLAVSVWRAKATGLALLMAIRQRSRR